MIIRLFEWFTSFVDMLHCSFTIEIMIVKMVDRRCDKYAKCYDHTNRVNMTSSALKPVQYCHGVCLEVVVVF